MGLLPPAVQDSAGNVIWLQFKVNARNIKETALARYFIKVTARPSFTRLRDIKWIIEFIKYKNRKCYKDLVVSPSYLNLLGFTDVKNEAK